MGAGALAQPVAVALALRRRGAGAGHRAAPARDLVATADRRGACSTTTVSQREVEEARGRQPILRPIFEPGDALFFDELFLHQTGSDPSMPKPRYAVENWFFGGSAFPAEYAPIAGVTSTAFSPELAPRRQPRPSARALVRAVAGRSCRGASIGPTAPGDARPSRAVVTIVHDEPVFLPVWLRYYSRFFAAQDIYVLDNESTGDIDRREGYVRIPATRGTVDHMWMVRTVEALQHELLERYDIVLVTDVDEIVAPHPRARAPRRLPRRVPRGMGELPRLRAAHMPDREPALRLDEPILDQRGYWFYNDGYSKAALATAPMSWRRASTAAVTFR